MKGIFFIAVVLFSICSSAEAQRYRNQNNLGAEEMVRFTALKNGDVLEFSWVINSTRSIETIELQKGNSDLRSMVEWVTVKKINGNDENHIDYLPQLGEVLYKLIVTDEEGTVSEYKPEFRLK
jgi:hypothetical protein